MDRILYIFLLLLGNIYYSLGCTNQTSINCSYTDTNTRRIFVWGIEPNGTCVMVPIGNTNFIFDPIMINSVWITLNNTDVACIANINARAQNIAASLTLASDQEVVLLNVTALFYRMVIVTKGCVKCTVNQFSTTLESKLRSANMTLYPIYNNLNLLGSFCRNNGTIDPTYTGAGYKCKCEANQYLYGPICEYIETNLTQPIPYFNIFQDATTINIRFSIFSNGFLGFASFLSIKNATYQRIVEIGLSESSPYLKTEDTTITTLNNFPLDSQNWFDISVVVTRQNATLTINSNTMVSNLTNQAVADFRAFYMIICETGITQGLVSIKNLITSSTIIDFNNPNYLSGCNSRCPCSSTQTCICRPFVSSVNPCYCKLGYLPSGNTCVPNNVTYSQINDSVTAVFPINNVPLATVDFGFQTLSINGTLLTVTSSNVTIAILIVNSNLMLNVPGLSVQPTIIYNVSNGQIHNVTLNVKKISLEIILDYNYNYSRNILNWIGTNVVSINVTTLTIGTMQKPFISAINNLTTCFSVIRLNSMSTFLDIFPSNNSLLSTQCTNGPRCTSGTVTCSLPNQVCMDTEWQNTKCICIANFTSVNSMCIYNQCIINPCLNYGQCVYNSLIGNYSCICPYGFSGSLCGTSDLWWIAVLVVLLLLLIVLVALIVYCCCYRTRNPDTVPIISKINENIVVYNEQAGECDYNGPPINFALMKSVLKNDILPTANGPTKQNLDLMNRKEEFDKNNNDLILDHPLQYEYEGNDSDNNSVSSIGSRSTGSQFDDFGDDSLNNIINLNK